MHICTCTHMPTWMCVHSHRWIRVWRRGLARNGRLWLSICRGRKSCGSILHALHMYIYHVKCSRYSRIVTSNNDIRRSIQITRKCKSSRWTRPRGVKSMPKLNIVKLGTLQVVWWAEQLKQPRQLSWKNRINEGLLQECREVQGREANLVRFWECNVSVR